MPLRFRVTSVTSNTDEEVAILAAGVTCIVGGNNAGKSQLLRDISQYLADPEPSSLVALNSLGTERWGDDADAEEWLNIHAARTEDAPGTPVYYTGTEGAQLRLRDFRHYWNDASRGALGAAASFLRWHATAGSLVQFATGSVARSVTGPSPHPLTQLLKYGELEEELSTLSMEAFGMPLVLDRVSGDVRLRVGDPGVPVPLLNRPTREYTDAVTALPTLEHQGDGIKAFMGLALNILAGAAQVLLVDEPEAFLHPGQARALGRWLAKEAHARDKQVLLATHDRDLVLGLLDSDSPVKMIRVRRSGSNTNLCELSETQLADVWADPVLKYSNILQGLFHERVVICEADADCRFYSSVLDSLAVEKGLRSVADGTLFVPSGGKQRVATLARALRILGVEAYALPDFDILRVKTDVQTLLEALGGDWTDEIDGLYLQVAQSIPDQASWSSLKNQGVDGLKAGPIFNSGKQLLELLAASGLRVVPVGEMEDFDKSIGLHGSAWVTAMLEARKHSSCEAAREFVSPLMRPNGGSA